MTKAKKIALITTGVLVIAGAGAAIYLYRVGKTEREANEHQALVDKEVVNPFV